MLCWFQASQWTLSFFWLRRTATERAHSSARVPVWMSLKCHSLSNNEALTRNTKQIQSYSHAHTYPDTQSVWNRARVWCCCPVRCVSSGLSWRDVFCNLLAVVGFFSSKIRIHASAHIKRLKTLQRKWWDTFCCVRGVMDKTAIMKIKCGIFTLLKRDFRCYYNPCALMLT